MRILLFRDNSNFWNRGLPIANDRFLTSKFKTFLEYKEIYRNLTHTANKWQTVMERPIARGTEPRTSRRFESVAPNTVRTRTNEMAASMKNPLKGVMCSPSFVLPSMLSSGVNACRMAAPGQSYGENMIIQSTIHHHERSGNSWTPVRIDTLCPSDGWIVHDIMVNYQRCLLRSIEKKLNYSCRKSRRVFHRCCLPVIAPMHCEAT